MSKLSPSSSLIVSSIALLTTAQILLLLTFALTSGEDVQKKAEKCKVKYANFSTSWAPLIESCKEKTKVDLKSHPIYQTKADYAVEEFDFDDKCYFKCLFEGLDLLGRGQLPDKLKTGRVFDYVEMTTELLVDAIGIWNSCIDDAENIGKNRGLGNCKVLAIHAYCVELDLGSKVYDCANPDSMH